jgi:hypothetical protein
MNDLQLGYVAGIYDGEGSVIIQTQNNSSKHASVKVKSTDLDILEKLQSFTEMGNINGPYQELIENRKPYWNWNVYKMKDVKEFLTIVQPLVSKRRQADMKVALALIDTKLDRAIICSNCQEEFIGTHHRARFCSKRCQNQWSYYGKGKNDRVF